MAVAAAAARERGARDEAAHELFVAHYARLAGWIAGLVGERELAHDLATEAFVRLLGRWTRVEDPRAYLYVVASNLVRDHWRREETARRAAPLLVERRTEPPVDTTVRDVVRRLPERLRQPVLLHYYADLSVAEVARLLKRPEGTVKRALSDARTALLGALTDSEDLA